jgi:hypothetical protein
MSTPGRASRLGRARAAVAAVKAESLSHPVGSLLMESRGSRGRELEQGAVDRFGVRPADIVRAAVDADEADVGDQVGQLVGRRGDRQDPVVRAVDDECGHVDLREIVAEVGEPGVDDT